MFSLRFPFRHVESSAISKLNEFESLNQNNLTYTLKVEDSYHILSVSGFSNEIDAKKYLSEIKTGFQWLLLKYGFAIEANWDFRHVEYSDDPVTAAHNLFGKNAKGPVEGMFEADYPSVYPSGKKFTQFSLPPLQVSIGVPVNLFFQTFNEGNQKRVGNHIKSGSKLETAIDLYNFYYYAKSLNAKLITLVMALETVSETIPKHKSAQDLIDEWRDQITEKKEKLLSTEIDHFEAIESLEALEREILYRKNASLRSQIRSFVKRTLNQSDNPEAESLSRIVIEVYDARSSLIHDGNLQQKQLQKAISDAKTIVETVLKAIFISI